MWEDDDQPMKWASLLLNRAAESLLVFLARARSIVVVHDHLVVELYLHKVKVFVAVQLQSQQHIPKSCWIQVFPRKLVFHPGQGQPDLLAINLCYIAWCLQNLKK